MTNPTPALILDYMTFPKTRICWFLEDMEELRKAQKKLFDYRWDNHHEFVTNIYGQMFAFNVYHDKPRNTVRVSFWDQIGTVSLGGFSFVVIDLSKSINDLAVDSWRNMLKRMDQYTQGIIHCSDCEKEISLLPHRQAYFAGRYCDDCWNSKWKAIEAAESYE